MRCIAWEKGRNLKDEMWFTSQLIVYWISFLRVWKWIADNKASEDPVLKYDHMRVKYKKENAGNEY